MTEGELLPVKAAASAEIPHKYEKSNMQTNAHTRCVRAEMNLSSCDLMGYIKHIFMILNVLWLTF